MAAPGAHSVFSGGVTVNLIPEVWIDTNTILEIKVCGQSLCQASDAPMPYGCHSCVDQICDADPTCCDTAYSQACVDKVNSNCGLTCE